MGFLSNLFNNASSGGNPYPYAIALTADGTEVAQSFLKHLEEAYGVNNRNYSQFFDVVTGPQGNQNIKEWFRRFTKEELLGHNYADWLETCTKICFEPQGANVLTDAGLTKFCKAVQDLL